MALHFSEPLEAFIGQAQRVDKGAAAAAPPIARARFVIVGSGYGGAVAAYRLGDALARQRGVRAEDGEAGATIDVLVLERGAEYAPGDFPQDLANVPNNLRYQGSDGSVGGSHRGLFDLRFGDGVDALVGNGLGGGSLINANVAARPADAIFERPGWPVAITQAVADGSFARAYDEVEHWLGVQRDSTLATSGKFRALDRLARGLRTQAAGAHGLRAEAAPIAVTRGTPGGHTVNAAGIAQPHCTDCGNCVSGCNVGAKNTLVMNLIPAAWQRGVRFVTNASVVSVHAGVGTRGNVASPGGEAPTDARWRIAVRPTGAHDDALAWIEADNVVLAAGALGSTEILLRSRRFANLDALSPALGRRFSTNGDAIAMTYAGDAPVRAIGTERRGEQHDCGPTISAMVRGTFEDGRHFSLEDAAIPAALQAPYGELLVTAAQLGRLGSASVPRWFRDHPDADPIAVHPPALARSQTLLLMTEDGADGTLALRSEAGDAAAAWQHVVVPCKGGTGTAAADAHLEPLDRELQRLNFDMALDGAQYVANPMWRPMPPSAAQAMSGTMPGGRLVTVHPLGGCAMADRWQDGVVDADGRVRAGEDGSVYAGLYVLDGAIVPMAIGTNPFLTIAALAWRACDAMLAGIAAQAHAGETVALRPLPALPFPHIDPGARTGGATWSPRTPTELVMRERLVGTLAGSPKGGARALARALGLSLLDARRLLEEDGLVLDVQTLPASSDAFIDGSAPVQVRVDLYLNPVSARRSEARHAYGMNDATLAHATRIAHGGGTLTALTRVRHGRMKRWTDTANALLTYYRRRGVSASTSGESLLQTLRSIPPFVRIAAMHAQHREFTYALELAADVTGTPLRLEGRKVLAWHSAHARIWTALTEVELGLRWHHEGHHERLPVHFVVDTEHMFGEGLITTERAAHGPDITARVLAMGGRFARAILQTSFWEFGGTGYPASAVRRNPHPPRLRTRRGEIDPVAVTTLHVPRFVQHAGSIVSAPDVPVPTVPIAITRYPNPGARSHVVLVHGLAQGSLIWCSPAIGTSMAQYLHAQGHEVWMLDYRLSNRFSEDADSAGQRVPFDGWCMDEIGLVDMPAALRRIVQETRQPVHVIAHCVGAVGMEIAIARGLLGRDEVASLTLNAIHPWVQPAPANRVRAKLGVFFRDVLGNDLFDPIPQARNEVSAAQSILDRFAFAFARIDEECEDVHPLPGRNADAALANAICDRMTFLYGRMWRHANIAPALHRAWKDIVGRAPGAVFRHMYYMLVNQVVLNADGEHVYMTDDNVRANWQGIPTLFLHGEESDVFNPQSATESALRLSQLVDPAARDGRFGDATLVKLLRVPGYGHMDVIFGRHAVNDVFPHLQAFIANPAAPRAAPFQDIHDSQQTIAIPKPPQVQLRGAWIDAKGALQLRYVGALPAIATPTFDGLALVHPTMRIVRAFRQPQANHPRFLVVDAEVDPDAYSPPGVAATVEAATVALPGDDADSSALDALAQAQLGAGTRVFSLVNAAQARAHGDGAPHWLRRLRERHARGGAALPDMHFIAGACLYPGTPFDRNVPERIFGAMARHMDDEPVDLLLLAGDQIYADATAGLNDPAGLYDRYTERYETLLRSPLVAHMLLRVPTHVALDDHEITDNFAGVRQAPATGPVLGLDARLQHRLRALRSGIVEQEQFAFARGVAVGFIGSGRDVAPVGSQPPSSSPLWYALDAAHEVNCPTFIADTRTERSIDPVTGERTLFGSAQFAALQAWLLEAARTHPAQPKFIACGSVIAPLLHEYHAFPALWRQEDGFAGYPQELGTLFALIARERIRGVVFVGGDLHLSAIADIELHAADQPPVQVLQVVASGLYAPLPFTNTPWRYYNEGIHAPAVIHHAAVADVRAHYRATLLTDASSHFVKVDATAAGSDGRWQLRIRAIDVGGQVLAEEVRTT